MHNMAGEVRPLHGVGWTLLHEMLFYYIFSLSLLLRQSAFVFSSIIIAGLWVVGRFVEADTALEQVAYSPLNLLFIAGMVLAWQYQRGKRLSGWLALIALLFGVLTIVSAELLSSVRGVFGEFRVSAVLIVAAALSLPVSGIPRIKKTLVGLGDSSYSLYLLHPIAAPLICVALAKAHIGSPVLIFVIAFMLCVAGAHIVYLVLERKLNQAAWTALKNLLGARLAAPTFVKK
jgi:peptidoglycan/LPS O-acetylase OafA/YrhL